MQLWLEINIYLSLLMCPVLAHGDAEIWEKTHKNSKRKDEEETFVVVVLLLMPSFKEVISSIDFECIVGINS